MSKELAQEWLRSQNKFQIGKKQGKKLVGSPAKTISVTSGKGGVGKTSISVKTGKLLSSWGYRTLLIDCDYNLSNTKIKLGLPVNDYFNEYIKKERSFDDAIFKDEDFHLLGGCNGNEELFNNGIRLDQTIVDILTTQEMKYDFIILDCPAGIGKETLTLNAYSDFRFFVITPDKSSVTDSYSLMKILHSKFGVQDFHLMANKISNSNQYKRLVKVISETVESFLNCRMNILGGLQMENVEMDSFDQLLLADNSSRIHKNLFKIIQKFTEKGLGLSVVGSDSPSFHQRKRPEQDVQSILS